MDVSTLPVGTPETIEVGMIWMESIENILSKSSIDGGSSGYWERLLDGKRRDSNYAALVRTLRENGFKRPVTCYPINRGSDFRFGDGHHRLAAAIELGFTQIPIQAYNDGWDCVSNDSGSWRGEGDRVPWDAPIPGQKSFDYDEDEEDDEMAWECYICGEQFYYEDELNDHNDAYHNDDNDDEDEDTETHPSQRTYENWCAVCNVGLWNRSLHNSKFPDHA